jgi:NADPH-dependent curcumin reductase CurA
MQGFVVFDFADKYAEARKQLAQWLSEGKLKRKETIIKGGINKAEDALVGLFEGKNTGKLVSSRSRIMLLTTAGKIMVQVADPEAVKARL